jgi:uncharacterized protein YdeI (YjbR/CyaY-like superfamily)
MGRKNPRVDRYIAGARPFARPILRRVRTVFHAALPGVEETIKWSMPAFAHKGTLACVGAFQSHCTLVFTKGALVVPGVDRRAGGMGQFGRITSVADLPPRAKLIAYLKKAVELNEQKVSVKRRKLPPIPTPAFVRTALAKNARAKTAFAALPPGHKREYLDWITAAKLADTRRRRTEKMIARLAEGKPRTP